MALYNILLSNLNNEITASIVYYVLVTVALLFICSIANFITKRFILSFITKIISNGEVLWSATEVFFGWFFLFIVMSQRTVP